MALKKISIIIPAYNEADRLPKTLDNYLNYFFGAFQKNFELILVTDGCQDSTPQIASYYSNLYPRVIKHLNFPKRLGKGGAVIQGFKVAEGEIVGFVDADGSIPPDVIHKLIEVLDNGCWDGVIASRWLNGSRILRYDPVIRRIASRAFNFLVRSIFDLDFRDTQCGAKFFRRDAIMKVLRELGTSNFAFDVELLYRLVRSGHRILEYPVVWSFREGTKVKILKTPLQMFVSIMRLRVKLSRLKGTFLDKFMDKVFSLVSRVIV
ncbi:MAG: dolichyl-phosphate beta-glucosyltransferase [Candidatus Baldrarchaeia archaeon]